MKKLRQKLVDEPILRNMILASLLSMLAKYGVDTTPFEDLIFYIVGFLFGGAALISRQEVTPVAKLDREDMEAELYYLRELVKQFPVKEYKPVKAQDVRVK